MHVLELIYTTYQARAASHEHPSKYDRVQGIDIDIEHGKHPGETQQDDEQCVRAPQPPK